MDEQRRKERAERLARLRERHEFEELLDQVIWGTPGAQALRKVGQLMRKEMLSEEDAWRRLTPDEQQAAQEEIHSYFK